MARLYPEEAKIVLRHDEGVRKTPYRDTKNLWTIGVGRLIGADLKLLTLSDKIIDAMLEEDISEAVEDVCAILDSGVWEKLGDARKVAVISLLFSLGRNGFEKFRKTIAAIRAGDWVRASQEILLSKWAADVDPKRRSGIGRDDRIAYMMRFDQFPKDYDI
jgi:GH24 family phage-related lysozyme (muramidase)